MLGLLGAAAIVFSAVAYSLGSVVARPLTKTTNATFLSGLTMLLGGLMTIGAWAFKPGAKAVVDLPRFRGVLSVWDQTI